jgi:hypothetical protein
MYSSFKQFLVEEEKVVYFTFGRMNPPTIGHGKLLDKIASTAGRNPYKVFLSQSQDAKKNPLSYTDKVKHARKMFPKHARQILINRNVKTAMDAAVELYDQGYRKIVMVVGSDRIREFDVLLNKYNGQKARHGFYNFKDIKVISAGDRDPDAEGVEGMSASKMRAFASDNDFTLFSQGLPKTMSNADAKRLFNDVRKGMGLKEEKEFKNHIQLDPVSQIREDFVAGRVLNLGDKTVLKGTDIVAEVTFRGSNYVIVEGSNGQTYRKWIADVEIIEQQDNKKSMYKDKPDWGTPESTKKAKKMTPGESIKEDERKKESPQDPDIKDRPGTQPKAYHKGVAKKTKAARDRHFKRGAKMDDDNPKAYKPAPGDATAKTKPSKHTKKFKQMFGEEEKPMTAADIAKMKIDREKKADAMKHDRMMDRARMRDTKKKNRETDA